MLMTDFDVSTIIRSVLHLILLLEDFKLEAQVVNGDGVLAGKVLKDSSEEGLGEVKTRHPKHIRSFLVVYPVLEKFESNTIKNTFYNNASYMYMAHSTVDIMYCIMPHKLWYHGVQVD